MKRILVVIMVFVLVLTMVSCGKDDLIGKWEIKDPESPAIVALEFTEDTMIMFGVEMDYKVKSDQIVMSFMGQEQKVDFKIKEDVLTLKLEGESLEFSRVKE